MNSITIDKSSGNNTAPPEPNAPSCLLFTDLDGTLLDHYTYSYAPALPLLRRLKELQIPLICNTSKTFAELLPLREQLNNHAPFITENGAGVYLPLHFAAEETLKRLGNPCLQMGYWRFGLSRPRTYWQALLRESAKPFHGLYCSFQQMGDAGIAQITGLSLADAKLANQREFSEPLLWLGDSDSKRAFIGHMHQLGANVQEGGRFLHIVGDSDKGKALRWLHRAYTRTTGRALCTIAAGDGANDIPMLEAADYGLIVTSPVNPAPVIRDHAHCHTSPQHGPAGWAQGIAAILKVIHSR